MSIWRPASVKDAPEIFISPWSVFEMSDESGVFTRHVVGYDNTLGEGKCSSAIKRFNRRKKIITTRSGRKYKLGTYGMNRDALYVMNAWKHINKITKAVNVSEEYLK